MRTLVSLVSVLLSVAACGATNLRPEAAHVIVSRQPAPTDCRYVGSVIGEQGGAIEGGFTSNRALLEGAMNDMKNKAAALGADYVVLEESKAGNTLAGSGHSVSGQQTDVTNFGNAYSCKAKATR
jgi:hypothetical protein